MSKNCPSVQTQKKGQKASEARTLVIGKSPDAFNNDKDTAIYTSQWMVFGIKGVKMVQFLQYLLVLVRWLTIKLYHI